MQNFGLVVNKEQKIAQNKKENKCKNKVKEICQTIALILSSWSYSVRLPHFLPWGW